MHFFLFWISALLTSLMEFHKLNLKKFQKMKQKEKRDGNQGIPWMKREKVNGDDSRDDLEVMNEDDGIGATMNDDNQEQSRCYSQVSNECELWTAILTE